MQLINKNILTLCLAICCVITTSSAQFLKDSITVSGEELRQMIANEDALQDWLDTMQTPGVIVEGDKMKFSEEAQKLGNDAAYRASVYKDAYKLTDIQESIEKFEIQKAFWRMINLYPENKELVLSSIYAYDTVIPSDKLVVASFYTYAFFDPRITTIKDGKPSVERPDLFEHYFRITKEIVAYITAIREQDIANN